jgi:serine/threonine-protein kinase
MQLPARIGKYELEEFLGGGMSHVYRARDTVIGRTVAVKILTEAGCQDAEAKARFLAEARMAGNISHDNVLSIYDFGEDEWRRPFMVMEFLRGEDLRHAIREGRTGDLKAQLRIALQIARALEHIHSLKIIHRDIKPENVRLTPSGVVKLMDFGIAKTEGLAMTRAGYVLGTPYYMAPEQVMGSEITEQVDVYAFGILLFELITGAKPITGETVERIFYSILNEPLNLDPLRQSGAPEAVCELVEHCTRKNLGERPLGFAPVRAELDRIVAGLEAPTVVMPETQPEKAPPPPPPRPAWLAPAIVLLAVGVAAGGWYALKDGNVVPDPPKKVLELPKMLATSTGEMVLVPAGDFLMGNNKEQVSLPAFYIDRTEVPNSAYGEFCAKTNRSLPPGFAADRPDYPVVNISIDDARAFAQWAEKKLPAGPQWEKAARGTDGRFYPWGNEQDNPRANVNGKELHPVADFAGGASPYGALNMLGNAWEWVDQATAPSDDTLASFKGSNFSANEPWYNIRGLSFRAPWKDTGLSDKATIPARLTAPDIGFRCVKDPPSQ